MLGEETAAGAARGGSAADGERANVPGAQARITQLQKAFISPRSRWMQISANCKNGHRRFADSSRVVTQAGTNAGSTSDDTENAASTAIEPA
jgi:hypothetical protein